MPGFGVNGGGWQRLGSKLAVLEPVGSEGTASV